MRLTFGLVTARCYVSSIKRDVTWVRFAVFRLMAGFVQQSGWKQD